MMPQYRIGLYGSLKADLYRFPVVSLGAEYLVMGHLMRRNILAYKAPPNHEGYDLICIHPDPRVSAKQIRVQVKSRLATDCDRGFPVRERSFSAFDFVIVAFLNVGYFSKKATSRGCRAGAKAPEFLTIPVRLIRKHHRRDGRWEKFYTRGLAIERYPDEVGFEQNRSCASHSLPREAKTRHSCAHSIEASAYDGQQLSPTGGSARDSRC